MLSDALDVQISPPVRMHQERVAKSLDHGRPRTPAVVFLVFLLLGGAFNSVNDQDSQNRFHDSMTLSGLQSGARRAATSRRRGGPAARTLGCLTAPANSVQLKAEGSASSQHLPLGCLPNFLASGPCFT